MVTLRPSYKLIGIGPRARIGYYKALCLGLYTFGDVKPIQVCFAIHNQESRTIVNKARAVMPSASFAVTYTSVYTNYEPGSVFWGVDDEEVSERGIPRVIVLGYDGIHMQPAHDLDYVPEPIYPEYIPLEDEHEFLTEEQPLPPVDLPTAKSPGYVTESDPKEDPEDYEDDETEDGPVDYLMDRGDDGDDDDGNSSGDGVNDEDEDDEDDEEEEEEEHLASADSAVVIPIDKPVSPPDGTWVGLRLLRWNLTAYGCGFKSFVGITFLEVGKLGPSTYIKHIPMRDMRREIGNMQAELLALREQRRRARQPARDARIPDHQDASGDDDSHV
ncbi:hypothetical protein Tco_1476308 [Tanacetum coccineum]